MNEHSRSLLPIGLYLIAACNRNYFSTYETIEKREIHIQGLGPRTPFVRLPEGLAENPHLQSHYEDYCKGDKLGAWEENNIGETPTTFEFFTIADKEPGK